jgi:uncharacterized protein (DUF924 family)
MATDADAQALVDYWFSEEVAKLWFNSTPEFDAELKLKYEPVLKRASQGELDAWQEDAVGALALCILFDQIPLNIYRKQAASFATEARARDVANYAIEKGLDAQLSQTQKIFLYMPFMHSEDIADQDRSIELFEKAGLGENAKYAHHHREIIKRFGRFPHRNAALGRESTSEEVAYLTSDEAFRG